MASAAVAAVAAARAASVRARAASVRARAASVLPDRVRAAIDEEAARQRALGKNVAVLLYGDEETSLVAREFFAQYFVPTEEAKEPVEESQVTAEPEQQDESN